MSRNIVAALGLSLAISTVGLQAEVVESEVSCADLQWSAEVLAQNPDIGKACKTVYEKDGSLFAKASIEVVRVRGNRMTFRTLLTDGTKGQTRSVQLESNWRAKIGGRQYRASDLSRGQQLNVYMPQDRFALTVADAGELDTTGIVAIEESVAMPSTASPLFLFGLAGSGFLALGGLLNVIRRRVR